MLKYQKEIDQMWELLYEDWMTELDKTNYKNEIYKRTGKSDEILNEEFEVGVQNGYSVEF